MADKRSRLVARARETVRAPQAQALAEDRGDPKGYRVVAVSLYLPEANWIDHATRSLQVAGNPKANRSLVVREAILRLQESLDGKSPAEILADFTSRQAKRQQGYF